MTSTYSNNLKPVEFSGFPQSLLFRPDLGLKRDAVSYVVILHGSGGPLQSRERSEGLVRQLLQRGLGVLLYHYFGLPGLPELLYQIELKHLLSAIERLIIDEKDRRVSVGLMGFSRGAEMALLFGSLAQDLFPLKAIAVHAPSDCVVGAWDSNRQEPIVDTKYDSNSVKKYQYGAAWLWNGVEIHGDQLKEQSVHPDDLFAGLDEASSDKKWNELVIPGMRIPVETIKAPVYIGHGNQDQVWGHDRSVRMDQARRKVGLETSLRIFAGEGHVFSKAACVQEFEEIAEFFSRNL
ncbi:MAG: alpha/beta hydrolase [Proteobacteria bacterium]|nr:alpha/beta hydrolase [Pseudomonadota bacterium]